MDADAEAFVAKWCGGHDSITLGPKIRADLATLLRRYAASRLREAAGKLRERHAPASDIDTYFADWLAERAAAEERG